MKIDLTKNTIICGDNIEWLNDVPDGSIDLCYIDPPFFSNQPREIIWGNGAERRSYEDRTTGGLAVFQDWLKKRIIKIHEKLKTTGIIVVHCDYHASYKIRNLIEDIFKDGFINEVAWKRVGTVKGNGGQGSNKLNPNFDLLFFYSKSITYTWNTIYTQYRPEYLEEFYKYSDENGRYRLISMIGPGGKSKGNPKYEIMGVEKYWRYSKKTMDKLIEQNMIVQLNPGNVPQKKKYLDLTKGSELQTLWDDCYDFRKQKKDKPKENLKYPTQKPECLLERIIALCSNKGDIVLDCFAGGGVTAKVCADMGRNFIVGDVSPVAVKLINERLKLHGYKSEVKNMPTSKTEFRHMKGHDFAKVVCDVMGWKKNPKESNDGGIDGWDGNNYPVQIKNSEAGEPDLRDFAGALQRAKSTNGSFIAWGFSAPAKGFASQLRVDSGIDIELLHCEKDIFKGLIVSPEKEVEFNTLYEKVAI